MAKASRDKGKRGEREVVAICEPFWPNAKRGLSQSRHGSECADVEGTPFRIEVKNTKLARPCQLQEWWAQASRDSSYAKDRRPILIAFKRHHKWRCQVMQTIGSTPLIAEYDLGAFLQATWSLEQGHEVAA